MRYGCHASHTLCVRQTHVGIDTQSSRTAPLQRCYEKGPWIHWTSSPARGSLAGPDRRASGPLASHWFLREVGAEVLFLQKATLPLQFPGSRKDEQALISDLDAPGRVILRGPVASDSNKVRADFSPSV